MKTGIKNCDKDDVEEEGLELGVWVVRGVLFLSFGNLGSTVQIQEAFYAGYCFCSQKYVHDSVSILHYHGCHFVISDLFITRFHCTMKVL